MSENTDDQNLGRLAHRLNNASMAILTSVELISEELGRPPTPEWLARQRRLVQEALSGIDRLTEIVRDLRGLSWGGAAHEPVRPVETPAAEHERRNVLVIDDETALLGGIVQVLDRDQVTAVTGGREALALLEKDGAFDVVLCDLVMSEVDGMAVYRWLSQHQPALAERTIFMTAGAFTAEAREFLGQITNPILRKPFDARTLRWVVAQTARRTPPRND